MTPATIAAIAALTEALRADDTRRLIERAEAAERAVEHYRNLVESLRADARARDAADRARDAACARAGRVLDALLVRKLRGYEQAREQYGRAKPSDDEMIVRELWERRRADGGG